MPTLEQYSIVGQAAGAEPYVICAYSGTDLSEVLGISQADSMPEGSYGWMQLCGEVRVRVSGQTQAAYADFRPNDAKLHLTRESTDEPRARGPKLPPGGFDDKSLDQQKYQRLSELPALLIEVGPYCDLLREARDVFVDGHFYACVAMCGISLERFQRDKAKKYGAERKKISKVRHILEKKGVLTPKTLELCKGMADLRNDYAHGHDGLRPREDARKALKWMHDFIDNETSLMRDYVIKDGVLCRNKS